MAGLSVHIYDIRAASFKNRDVRQSAMEGIASKPHYKCHMTSHKSNNPAGSCNCHNCELFLS